MSIDYVIETEKVILKEVMQRVLISIIEEESRKEKMEEEALRALMLPRRIKSIKHDKKSKTIVIEYD